MEADNNDQAEILKYAVLNADENWIETGYHETEEAAIAEWETMSGESWDNSGDHYHVMGFTPAEIAEIAKQPDR